MINGARKGTLSGLRRLVGLAMAQDLGVYVVPGIEIARVHGLDIEAAGMQIVASPRHASVLLIVGEVSPALLEAAAVIYAQMMRPRVLFVLNSTDTSPLPTADIVAEISQQGLIDGVRQLRTALADGAFRADVADFDAPVLQVRIEYTCSMHPEIAEDEPGSCPKCGMDLIPREVQASSMHTHTEPQQSAGNEHSGMDHSLKHDTQLDYTCPMHPEVVQTEPGSCPKCGMHLEPRKTQGETTHEHQHAAHAEPAEYTCPMHPEVVQADPGSCPKCGMHLEPRKTQGEITHEHQHAAHVAPTEYTCPMHPEVVQTEPGSCPKCGMHLEPRKTQGETAHTHQHGAHTEPAEYTCPMHPEVIQAEPGSCPQCGMHLELRKTQGETTHTHQHGAHVEPTEYTCPMHPEVVQSEPGSCPKCGMHLEPRKTQGETTHEHQHAAQVEPTEYTCPMHPEVVQAEP
ncbi:MAG: heavy metal-binding domain-containing protein, partial [Thiohalomonadales bacterium]